MCADALHIFASDEREFLAVSVLLCPRKGHEANRTSTRPRHRSVRLHGVNEIVVGVVLLSTGTCLHVRTGGCAPPLL